MLIVGQQLLVRLGDRMSAAEDVASHPDGQAGEDGHEEPGLNLGVTCGDVEVRIPQGRRVLAHLGKLSH